MVRASPESLETAGTGGGSRGRGIMALAAIGDLVLIGAFIFMGQITHKAPLTFGHWAKTAAPFLIAWLAVGALTGMFRSPSLDGMLPAFLRTAAAWLAAGAAALLIRSYVEGRGIPWAFAGVVIGTNIGVLGAWRTALAAFTRPS